MSLLPAWLADEFPISPWNNETYDKLYEVFVSDFKVSQPTLAGSVVLLYDGLEDGKEGIFWHVTSIDDKESGDRLPDLPRCARIRWIRSIIENSEKPEVQMWDYLESNGAVHTYLWLKEHDFVVILKKHRNSYHLKTAYHVKYSSTKRNLTGKYEKRLKGA